MTAKNNMNIRSKEIVEEYISSLNELIFNSKPLINMLTILAEDYMEHAEAIVEAVEDHLQKVRSDIKLPVLYLIDSIVKNVNRAYLPLFTKNIVNTFCSVFEKVDESTRSCMWKLRQTWNEVFPMKKLFALDYRVHNIDPAWPVPDPDSIGVATKSLIHVNPKFFSMQQKTAQPASKQPTLPAPKPLVPTTVASVSVPTAAAPAMVKLPPLAAKPLNASEAEMHEQVLKKQRELIELQKQKVELELLHAKASLEFQRKQLDKHTLLKGELPTLPEGALEKTVAVSAAPKMDKTIPALAASLLKNDAAKSGVKIAPASSIAVASAKPISSRDPRLKGAASENLAPVQTAVEELAKQKQQIMQQFQLHMQSKLSGNEQSSMLNDPIKGTIEPEVTSSVNKSLINKRAKESCQKKEPSTSTTTTASTTTSQRSSSSSTDKESSKSSSSKNSSTRGSSSSSSSSKSSSSTSSSRKPGSKSRIKSSSSSKIPRLDENASPYKRSSSSSSSKKSSKSSSSSRKNHSPSPVPSAAASSVSSSSYRIPRRTIAPQQPVAPSVVTTVANAISSSKPAASALHVGLDVEEQPNSPIISSSHQPTSFKDVRSSTRNRNYVRRNKDGSSSPSDMEVNVDKVNIPDTSKDEDLRPIVSVNVAAAGAAAAANVLDTKEDLDLRVLTVQPNKRQSSDQLETSNAKRKKSDKFDALFGNEDVDLRTLTNPKAGRPPTPPPPMISDGEQSSKENKTSSWAKIKTPMKSERTSSGSTSTSKSLADRNRDRLGRPRLHNKNEDSKDWLIQEFNNIDRDQMDEEKLGVIMKQAAEMLDENSITKQQYNKIIQDMMQIREDQKLRVAQRKEKLGMLIWEKGLDGNQNFSEEVAGMRPKEPPMHPRGVPRWQAPWHQPWAHPPPFPGPPHGPPFPGGPDGFRPMGPWQNHPRMFGGPMRPDFHGPPPPPPPFPFNPRLGPPPPPMGPNGPLMMPPNGPMGPLPMPPMPPMMLGNGPIRPEMSKNNMPSSGTVAQANHKTQGMNAAPTAAATKSNVDVAKSGNPLTSVNGELPPADPKLLEEIAKDTMKSINIDSVPREIRYYGNIGIVFMKWDDPRDIGFQDGARRIFIDSKEVIVCKFNDDYKEFTYEGEVHRIKLGTPTRELYVDDKWYECYFGGRPILVDLGNKKVSVSLEGPPPQVKIGTIKRTDLVVGKINFIINAKIKTPVFLDSKPQMFEIENQHCTLEFIDSLQTVLLNGQPFKVEFGALPKPIMVSGKKYFIRFSVLPRGFRAGYVKITGMRGEQPKTEAVTASTSTNEASQKSETTAAATTTPATTVNPRVLPGLDNESPLVDNVDVQGAKITSSQIDVLSSVVPSAMAPASGQSYQAEPVENPVPAVPAVPLPLSLNELFQRLVETGIVPNLVEKKKEEEEEKKSEPEIIVSFDKPETLKLKNPVIVAKHYSGMQCSSCGQRFAPEMATRYSHHLDWHFRQNRRERDPSRKAHSRPWYYDVSDWIQFEEIEDLEDRAQSYFETEKQADAEGSGEDDSSEAQQPSVRSTSDEEFCRVCHEPFQHFFNEEKEEWHIRPAVSFEEKHYHPLCLEDHKIALEQEAMELEESITEMEVETNEEETNEKETNEKEMEKTADEDVEMKDVSVKKEEEEVETKPVIKEEDVEKIKIEIKVEDTKIEKEEVPDEEMQENIEDMDDSEPIEIIEPLPRQIELEEIDDSSDDEATQDAKKDDKDSENKKPEKIPDDVPLIFENVKVKEEPMDDAEPEESIAEATAVDTTQVAVKSTIDGNVEFESAAPTIPTAPSKIKLNITKTLNVAPKETDQSKEAEKKSTESLAESAPAKPLIPAAIKPSLQGKKLSILPTVEKGHELSGLCSVM